MAHRKTTTKNGNGGTLGFEAELFKAADKLRGNMEPSDYKHVALGLIFLKYISDAFEAKHSELLAEDPQAAEDKDEYLAHNVFWVPKQARWSHLKANAKQSTIGTLIDEAMRDIEKDNPSLKHVLPKDYARPALNKVMLGELIDLISGIALNEEGARSKDILGRVYEYFLGQFAGPKASVAASSTPRVPWCAFLSRCWNPTRAVSTTLLRLRWDVRTVGKVRPGAWRPHRRHCDLWPRVELHHVAPGQDESSGAWYRL